MLFLEDMARVVQDISFPNMVFHVFRKDSSFFLQIDCDSVCNLTGTRMPWKSRKWYLSPHMTRSEVVQTAFKAIVTALEHEARENFKYRGVTVLDPHLDLDNLVLVKSERAPA